MLSQAVPRLVRSSQTPLRSYVARTPTRAYAKVGKPKAPEIRKASHPAPSVASPKSTTASKSPSPTPTEKISAQASSTSNIQAKSTEPKTQDELDSEAVGSLPTSESASKSGVEEQSGPEQSIPLHDLTKGLPSTIGAELEEAERRQRKADGEEEEEPSKPSSGGRGERPARDYTTSAERRRNKMIGWVLVSLGLGALAGPVYLGRNWDTKEEEQLHPNAPNGWGFGLFWDRLQARLGSTLDYYNEPAFPKLLPDLEPGYERPYTLVLSLEDLLIHSEWTREHGWRIAKRPGLDYFLRYLQSYYEIVIFTSVPSMTGGVVLQKLDPFGIVPWRLFREATRYKNGEYVKVSVSYKVSCCSVLISMSGSLIPQSSS
jgi:mitochondrial import inner membrane translocase subunit TIM50